MEVEVVRNPRELAVGLTYYITLFMREYLNLMPLSKGDVLRLLTVQNPLHSDIDTSGIVEIVEHGTSPQLQKLEAIFRSIKDEMLDLLERRFGTCDCLVKVLYLPLFHPSARSKHHMVSKSESLVFLVPTGSEKHLLSVLGHELAHAIVRRNSNALKFLRYDSALEEAVISFFWPGVDAGSLGLSPFSLNNIEESYVHLYKEPKVLGVLKKILPWLLDYAKGGGGTAWDFLRTVDGRLTRRGSQRPGKWFKDKITP